MIEKGIDPGRDAEGLQLAALELLEESFDAPEREKLERTAAIAANRDAILEAMPQRRTLSPGYHMLIDYVCREVLPLMDAGVEYREADLSLGEANVLRALRRANGEFRKAHPPCRGCGQPLREAGVDRCAECQGEAFRRDGVR